jgi:hypothetical protein
MATGWLLDGVKLVLLQFNVVTQSNPYQAKLTSKIIALFKEKKHYSVESIGNLYVPESYVQISTLGLSLSDQTLPELLVCPWSTNLA